MEHVINIFLRKRHGIHISRLCLLILRYLPIHALSKHVEVLIHHYRFNLLLLGLANFKEISGQCRGFCGGIHYNLADKE